MSRPYLHPVYSLTPIEMPPLDPSQCYITMSVGQWDNLLSECYEQGWILVELDANERFVQAYQKPPTKPLDNLRSPA